MDFRSVTVIQINITALIYTIQLSPARNNGHRGKYILCNRL